MARFLVLGNVNLDEVVELSVPLVSGGRPQGRRRGSRLGGGGANTGVALAMAGHDVAVAAVVGDDPDGRHLRRELARHGVDVSLVAERPGRSRRALILVDPDGERTIVGLGGVTASPQALVPRTHRADALYVNVRHPDAAEVMARGLDRMLVVAQVPETPVARWPAHVLVASGTNPVAHAWDDPFAGGREIAGPQLRWTVVTDGARGATAWGPDGARHCPPVPARVVDTTGAGDAFAAGLLGPLVADGDIDCAMRTGAAWAAGTIAAFSSIPVMIPPTPSAEDHP
ncbi:MAG: PfkB family carbohydrate kinase [Acetobacterales bacterium]